MKLPNRDNLLIAPEKLTHYLLHREREKGNDKAIFFTKHGFSREDWPAFARVLRQHAIEHPVKRRERRKYGIVYEIEGDIQMPNGRLRYVRSVWQIDYGTDIPRLISAFPVDESGKT